MTGARGGVTTLREHVLRARDLTIRDALGRVLVWRADLAVRPGEVVGVAGESGSGKTLTMRACLGLLPRGLTWDAQELTLAGRSLAGVTARQRARLLGTSVGFVAQNTVEYLHPLMRVRDQMVDGYLTHHPDRSRREALARACELLGRIGIADPGRVLGSYPSQLSGGMRQRVNIAMALMGEPALVVADEPTAALDCVVARQVVDLLVGMARERGVALVMVSHGLSMLRSCCDEVVVMYAGRVVERGRAGEVFERPGHPYTRALIEAVPRVGHARDERLPDICGVMPEAGRDAQACLFAPRCPLAEARCSGQVPLVGDEGHQVACVHAWEGVGGDGPSRGA